VLLLACSVQICLDLVWTLGISTDWQTNVESCSEGGSLPTKHPESLGMVVSLCNACFPLRHLHLTTIHKLLLKQLKQPELLKYIEEHSNSMIPQVYEDNPALGKWVNRQRTKYKANNFFAWAHIGKLNEVGFCGMVKKLFA
jgi:hypothetical protein